ncbi:MAG TPA: hypothetical protein VFO65_04510, partial [Acidimicrobiales bacterium]|nr:hypothetical protein [Acidimicrobiales bacterium]
AFLDRDSNLLGYAKPMFIKPHHRPLYPHLFAGARKPLVPSSLSRPVARLTTMVHPVVTRYPRVAGISRRWSPEHRMVRPEQAMPGRRIATRAPLAAVVCIERHAGSRPVLEERDEEWMVARLIGNFHVEMAAQSQHLVTALGASGLVPLERSFGEKAAVLRRAVAGRPSMLLKVPRELSADAASGQIVEHLHGIIDRLGLRAFSSGHPAGSVLAGADR